MGKNEIGLQFNPISKPLYGLGPYIRLHFIKPTTIPTQKDRNKFNIHKVRIYLSLTHTHTHTVT